MSSFRNEAEAFDRVHDLGNAIIAYERHLVQNPNDHDARARWARLLIEQSEYEEARRTCLAGLEIMPSAPVFAVLAVIEQGYFQVESALDYAQSAIDLDGTCGDAWHALTTSLGLAGDEVGAEHALAWGLALCPGHVELLIEQATSPLFSAESQAERMAALRKRFPHSRSVQLSQSIVLDAAGQPVEADRIRLSLVKHMPRNHLVLALHALQKSQLDEGALAMDYAERALGLWPYSFFAILAEFRVHLLRSRLGLAQALTHKAAELSHGTSIHGAFVSRMRWDLGDFTGARHALEAQLDGFPDALEPLMGLARIAKEQKRYDEALAYLERAQTRSRALKQYDWVILEAEIRLELHQHSDVQRLLKTVESNAEVDALKLRVAVHQVSGVSEMRALYEGHLAEYPRICEAWELLFRHYVEAADLDQVCRLMAEPYEVPRFVQHATLAYIYSLSGDFDFASDELELFLVSKRTLAQWVWAWDLVFDAIGPPELEPYRLRLLEAAQGDGLGGHAHPD